MQNEVIIDGVNVAECNKFCKTDNYNEKNKCWSDISEDYKDCKPKDYQCFFYVKELEKQLQRAKKELEISKHYAELLKANICHHTVLGECSAEHHNNCVGKKQCILDLEQIISNLQAKNEKLKENLSDAEAIILTYKIERDNYKQALEDIREIVSAEIDRTDADDELMQIYGSIYNKINEVINNAN